MSTLEKAKHFAALHDQESPLVLYNAWDAGSATAIAEAGATAIATSSWAVAAAQGYEDGEAIPLDLAEQIIARIMASVDLPVTVDFEGGYSDDDGLMVANLERLMDMGVVGINFEDRIVSAVGLYNLERQAQRISALRKKADSRGLPLFINARTDVFLGNGGYPAALAKDARERAAAYAAAGASGFFIPGLKDEALIQEICEATTLPVNIMVTSDAEKPARLSELGVSRISFGPAPYIAMTQGLKATAASSLAPA
jgi:2-methylisocitrate lyase-like PEP mutase family enzyme